MPEAGPALPARPRCCKRLNLCKESFTLFANASAIPDVSCLRRGVFPARESAAVPLRTSPPGRGRGLLRASCTAHMRERRFHHGAARCRNEIAWTPELTRFGRRTSTTLNTSFVRRARGANVAPARMPRHLCPQALPPTRIGGQSTAIPGDPVAVSVMRVVHRGRESEASRAALDRMPRLQP
jgi:hypothetical protein